MLTKARSPPPPIPWMARPTISMVILTAAPHSALPRKNVAVAISKITFRPQISLNLPQLGATTAAESKNAEPIHVKPEVD
jgi:hypothetical protein